MLPVDLLYSCGIPGSVDHHEFMDHHQGLDVLMFVTLCIGSCRGRSFPCRIRFLMRFLGYEYSHVTGSNLILLQIMNRSGG